MNVYELMQTLELHKKWLSQDPEGKRADLQEADLRDADLRGADLRDADLRGADLRDADLRGADLQEADLQEADLRDADLRWADLQDADLRGADLQEADLREADLRWADLQDADLRGVDLDYSCLPLWCGSLKMTVDKRIAAQIAYHFCRLACDDPDYIAARNAILDFANQFHRAEECGALKPIEQAREEK